MPTIRFEVKLFKINSWTILRLPESASAKLPSRGELVAGILGSIQSPIAGLAGAVGAVMRDLVYIIDAIEKKKAA